MAARLNKRHSEDVRQKIQASVIVDRFRKAHLGELELSEMQYKTGLALLDRSVPKLAQIQHAGHDGGAIQITDVPWLKDRALCR